eukprot:CAMPEP_0174900328 /NCGR_PEP_ID=MMETSP0167-20121228/30728_1 /TAXON_ID=38298 /ORGANISM="Rhodella maculata, Strain CCMP736" /LENGTH=210 /DNA_ID=CAMNT_0016141655 /DNA_START=471 /DNA_END=1104 /DNA_ORIENTATION=+
MTVTFFRWAKNWSSQSRVMGTTGVCSWLPGSDSHSLPTKTPPPTLPPTKHLADPTGRTLPGLLARVPPLRLLAESSRRCSSACRRTRRACVLRPGMMELPLRLPLRGRDAGAFHLVLLLVYVPVEPHRRAPHERLPAAQRLAHVRLLAGVQPGVRQQVVVPRKPLIAPRMLAAKPASGSSCDGAGDGGEKSGAGTGAETGGASAAAAGAR